MAGPCHLGTTQPCGVKDPGLVGNAGRTAWPSPRLLRVKHRPPDSGARLSAAPSQPAALTAPQGPWEPSSPPLQ